MKIINTEIATQLDSCHDIDVMREAAKKMVTLIDLYEQRVEESSSLMNRMYQSMVDSLESIKILCDVCLTNGIELPARVTELIEQAKSISESL